MTMLEGLPFTPYCRRRSKLKIAVCPFGSPIFGLLLVNQRRPR